MLSKEKKMEVAVFRYGLISEFVTGTELSYGEKERLLREKVSRFYQIPHSPRRNIARSSIMSWIKSYKEGGRRIEALMPKPRKDKGNYRKLDPEILEKIRQFRLLNPHDTVPTLIKLMKQKNILSMDENIRLSSLYRFLKNEKLFKINEAAEDRRKFEAEYANQIWQSDVMHGPRVRDNGINKKAYLHAVIDDHSRYIVHAQFYLNERLDAFKDCLKSALEVRGLPQTLYVDNGSCYSAINLQQITACLGIGLKHSRPYTPQGRGKIERWFRNIRESFLPLHRSVLKLEALNECFKEWVEKYNHTHHSSIGMTPFERYTRKLECIRPAPPQLMNYFRIIKQRKVYKDRSFRINGKTYEAPAVLIDRNVELHFHQNDEDNIEIFYDGRSFGLATILDKHINSRIGREYKNNTGKLFDCDREKVEK